MALSGKVSVSARFTETGSGDLGTPAVTHELLSSHTFTDGTGANQADKIFSDTRTLAASATEDLDLAGSLGGLLGGTVVFAEVVGLIVKAASGNTNDVQVTRPASNGAPIFMAAGDGIALGPGEVFVWISGNAAGAAVTAGTGDLVTFTNSAGSTSVDYSVIVLGRSA